jgi:hypothetical protein
MKNKIIELIKESYKTMYGQAPRYGKTTYAKLVNELINKIQDMEFPVSKDEKKFAVIYYNKAINESIDMIRTLIKNISVCDVIAENLRDMEQIFYENFNN